MRQYIARIHKEPDSDYGVSFPDLLAEIDSRAERDGFTRSGYLAQAAKKALVA
jgi:hypothetical protein